jgi:hypothetical protein
MTRDADTGIVGEHALDARGHLRRAVGDDHLSCVLRVADADAASVVDRNPGCAAGSVEHRVQERPVRHSVRAVAHCFSFAIGRSDRAAIEVVSANHNRRLQLTARNEVVERKPELRALAIAEPADSRGQPLEAHAFLSQSNPSRQHFVLREHFEYKLIGAVDVGRLA